MSTFHRRVALVAASLATSTAAAAAPPPPPDVGAVDFATAVFAQVAAGRPGNLFLSPSGIRTALAIAAAGAAGDTRRQMDGVLHLPANAVPPTTSPAPPAAADGCQLDVATALWVDERSPLRPAFADRARAEGATARPADFAADPDAARRQINAWVADATRGKIRDLLPPRSVTGQTRLVLTDAVYFKGQWADPFLPAATADRPFHLDPSHDVPVRMMSKGVGRLPVFQTDAVSAVELPYRGSAVSMLVVIPTAVNGLPAVEHGLTGDVVRQWTAGLRPTRASLALPRFTATATVELKATLSAIGMPDAFDPRRADFSPMVDGPPLVIDQVFHKAYVAVDEQGTEAAAATALAMRPMLATPSRPALAVVADRPFLYLIRDRRTGAVLFIGRCADPRP